MIIVEGPDGAGKTTLLKKIQAYTNFSIADRVVSKDTEAMTDLVKWVEQNVDNGFQRVLFDRHRLISEPIYWPAIRPKPAHGFDDMSWFYTQLRKFYQAEPIIIYCLPPLSVVWGNIQHDPENQRVADQDVITKIWAGYFNKAMTDLVNYKYSLLYDYSNEAIARLQMKTICRLIDERTNG